MIDSDLFVVCCAFADEVSKPRPFPYMVFRNMQMLGVLNVSAVLKVDDTVSGVGEGLNAVHDRTAT
jgi:beta-phosphoglucomutase-like phosphatase (HAD superfamily)